MKAIKKRISLLLAGLMVAGAAATMPVKAEGGAIPPQPKFLMSKVTVNEGDQPTMLITTDYDTDVQYKVWYRDEADKWVSTDYSEAVNGKVPFEVELPTKVAKGENAVSIWVKRAGVEETAHAKGYDNYNYILFNSAVEGYKTGDVDYTVKGNELTVNGIEGLAETAKFKVNYVKIGENGYSKDDKWVVGEYTNEAQTVELEPGNYYLSVHINDSEYVREGASEDSWDAYRVELVTIEEKAAGKTVEFTTEVASAMIGANVTVSTTSTDVATYRLFQNDAEVTYDAVNVNEAAEGLFPAPKAGEMMTVKFYDANNAEVGSADVKLGEAGTITIEEKEMKEFEVEATVSSAMIGANVTVTCDDADVDTFRLFKDGEEVTYDAVKIGEAAEGLFPAPKAGEEVMVKLYDANGALLGEAATTLK